MDTSDEIAHCALMIDQARDLLERGDVDRARSRASTALESARAAQTRTDAGHGRQVQECRDAAEALLRRIDERQRSVAQPRK